jgi:hypothetical protein
LSQVVATIAQVNTAYEYPSVSPTPMLLWTSSTGVGNPTSNPSGWTYQGSFGCSVVDGGTYWECAFISAALTSGIYAIASPVPTDPSNPYTNVVHWS